MIDNGKPNKQRLWLVIGANAVVWTGSFLILNQYWYADYPRTSFHFFDDFPEWNQMDKLGHIYISFALSNITHVMWKWTGLSKKQSVILGGISGIAYQSIIEIQDGFSADWGFSLTDMAANIIGASAFVAQELHWQEKRIRLKLSYNPHNYPSDIVARSDELFGESYAERYLKDYNSQTYWASVNPRSFFSKSKFPKWLNIAAGYSTDLMLGGRENKWTDKQGNIVDRRDIERIRRYYLSPDIDLSRIPTNSKFLKTVLSLLAGVKVPAPALELNSEGKLKLHALYF